MSAQPVEVMSAIRAAAWQVAGPMLPEWDHRDDDEIQLRENEQGLHLTVRRAGDPDDCADTVWSGENIASFLWHVLVQVERNRT